MARKQNDENLSIPEIKKHVIGEEAVAKKYYFDNLHVESLVQKYVMRGCVDVELRDEIMSHMSELLRMTIRVHGLSKIYNNKDGTSFSELFMIGWVALESCLYKFDYTSGHKRIFNMLSQVARTSMLAYIKKESRHRTKAYNDTYKKFVADKDRYHRIDFTRFITELREICRDEVEYVKIIDCIEFLLSNDLKPYDGLMYKILNITKLPKSLIHSFFEFVRDNGVMFTDSPENQRHKYNYNLVQDKNGGSESQEEFD